MRMKRRLYVICSKSDRCRDKFISFAGFFDVKWLNSPVKISRCVGILFGGGLVYIERKLRRKYWLLNLASKILGKNFSRKYFLLDFFKYVYSSKEVLFLAHNCYLENMYRFYFDQICVNNIDCYNLDIADQDLDEKVDFFKVYKNIKNLLLNNTEYVDKIFTGKIFITNILSNYLIELIRIKWPNAQGIIIKLTDMVLPNDLSLAEIQLAKIKSFIAEIKKNNVQVVTYSKKESALLNLKYEPNGVNIERLKIIEHKSSKKYDVFYAGNSTGIRFHKIIALINLLEKLKCCYKFILTDLNDYEYNMILGMKIQNPDYISYSKISYAKIIEFTACSKAIVDIYRKDLSEGYSYRIPEALSMNVKIITDRTNLEQENFYNAENILCDQNLNFKEAKLITFINSPFKLLDKGQLSEFDIKNQRIYPYN